ncbi:L-type lectin-domain containing receptor kinase IX.1-like [Rosa rugosa]|uniref:L-type lectin-domain containing receptor kinase IX.1-like n=1 Tax=Rosa rugosa TaxID=74645 RepID=UPI002B4049BF|nr:L-type lectin-domain containing receptor kinase IX.1-like [Rosa rugosa]
MAVKNTFRLSLKQFQLLLLLLLLWPFSATPLTFNFPSFPLNVTANISMEGDALPDGSLRLTKSAVDVQKNQSVGRATYHQPFLLRQNSTGKLADFTSSFTFAINSGGSPKFGDGLAFFLAPAGSLLNPTLGAGRSLGLPVNTTLENYTMWTTEYPFVAVEFDIFPNIVVDLGVNYTHAGIDINSVRSKVTEPWNGGIMAGDENNATISYNSTSKNLGVAFTTFENGVQVIKNFSLSADLLQYLPDTVIVGFSAATGSWTALHKINSWSFDSTSLVDENSTSIPPDPTVKPNSGNANVGLVVGLVVGGGVILAGVLGLLWFIFCRKRKETAGESSDDDTRILHDLIPEEFEKGTGPRKFSYNELALATSNFEQREKLGEGGFGGVYKGFIKDMNTYVAVKKISRGSKQGLKEYAAEVSIISRLRHRNLVQLIGWCHEKKLLLVYEFMPNGSLDSHLLKEKSLLTWDVRYKIAHGLASGLLYLHQGWEQCVLHRDIKSSNVMLDSNFNAKLGDFGLAKLVDHGKLSKTTIVAGTMGYMATEYVTTGKASQETDVYSFGVVALEIACGRKPIDHRYEEKQSNMVEWVWELYGEGKIIEAADPRLCGEFDEKQMECLMMVGLWCAHPDYNCRPLIQQAIQVLNFEIPLPNLPLTMPVAFALPSSLSKSYSGDSIEVEVSLQDTTINSSQFTSSSITDSNPSG